MKKIRSTPPGLLVAFVLAFAAGCRDLTPPQNAPILATASRLKITANANPVETFYGPERFARTQGSLSSYRRVISTLRFEAPFTIHIRSGAADGSHRARAASVALDGKTLLAEQDFAQQSEWNFPVSLGPTATLEVTLAGAPATYLEIWIEGSRSYPVFCPSGPAGSYSTLAEAIAAVWTDGTVLVCNGEHSVDRVFVNKPLTLRSQNPGGATLSDADPSLIPQRGRPALIIDGIISGLVRIVDLNFAVGNRGIYAGGTFDRVELDSVNLRGRIPNLPIAVWVDASTRSSAKVEIMRSHFESMTIGVFTVRGVETNVIESVFETFANSATTFGSGITYSSNPATLGGPALASYGRAEHNTFNDCGIAGCIRVVGTAVAGADVLIAHNRFTRLVGASQQYVIFASRTGSAPINVVTIEDNDVTGAAPSGNPATLSSWTMQSFVRENPGTSAIVRNNRITNVHTGISAAQSVIARDNVFTGGFYAVGLGSGSAVIDFQRNDVIGHLGSFSGSVSTVNYKCNWWGAVSGPTAPVGPTNTYTPWSTVPIAGRPEVSCP